MNLEMNPNKIFAIAKKEYMDNLRNRWVLVLSLIFLVLTMVVSYFGGAQTGQGVNFQGFQATVEGMSTITSMLLPIIAIMLGYGTIISERENGSLGVVLGCPVSRYDVMIGKFLGLAAVLLTTILLGYGISGVIVGAIAGFDNGLEYILFMLLTFVFAMFFLGFSILMSTLASKRSTAIAGGLGLWFSGAIVGIILIGIWSSTGGDIMALIAAYQTTGEFPVLPDWFWAGEFFNFMDIYAIGSADLFGNTHFFGIEFQMPEFVKGSYIFTWFMSLSIISFIGSLFIFQKKDL